MITSPIPEYMPISSMQVYGGIYADDYGLAVAVFVTNDSKVFYLSELFYEPDTCTLGNVKKVVDLYLKKYSYIPFNTNKNALLINYVGQFATIIKSYDMSMSNGRMLINSMNNEGFLKLANDEAKEQFQNAAESYDPDIVNHRLSALALALAENNPYGTTNWLDALVK